MRQIHLAQISPAEVRQVIYGLVVPRPIAWVSTLSASGRANLAPHSFFNAVSCNPPILMFASTRSSRLGPDGRKDTPRNIEATGEFVVNIVSEDLLHPMVATSAEVAAGVDEFVLAQIEKHASSVVRPPRVRAARAALECRLHGLMEIGDATAIFGEVVVAHIAEDVFGHGRPDAGLLRPVSRLGGSLYAALGETTAVRRPDRPADEASA